MLVHEHRMPDVTFSILTDNKRQMYPNANLKGPNWLVNLCCLVTSGLRKDVWCRVWPYFSKLANHQIRHQATHKVGCQPGECIWSLSSSLEVCVAMYALTYSLYHPILKIKEYTVYHYAISASLSLHSVNCSLIPTDEHVWAWTCVCGTHKYHIAECYPFPVIIKMSVVITSS